MAWSRLGKVLNREAWRRPFAQASSSLKDTSRPSAAVSVGTGHRQPSTHTGRPKSRLTCQEAASRRRMRASRDSPPNRRENARIAALRTTPRMPYALHLHKKSTTDCASMQLDNSSASVSSAHRGLEVLPTLFATLTRQATAFRFATTNSRIVLTNSKSALCSRLMKTSDLT